ncbi:MAG: hypothetical protein OXC31_10355, partial [Spirochaetaceae bacterium]|nr:hypothetical protein [Spirochaetaceae bacterium]
REREAMAFRSAPPGVVVGPLGDGRLNLKRDWDRARARTDVPLKFTVSSPYLLARTVADAHYGNLEPLAMAFAELLAGQIAGIGAAVVQVDEPNLPGSPGDGPLAAAAINRLLDGVESGTERAVHLCFGNYGGQMIQRGDYGRLIAFMNALRCDHLVLETTRRSPEELDRLADVRADIRLGLGVIDVKDLQVETPEQVARRIEALARRLGAERIAYLHPDCGLRVLPRPVADGKLRALVSGRDRFLGRG